MHTALSQRPVWGAQLGRRLQVRAERAAFATAAAAAVKPSVIATSC